MRKKNKLMKLLEHNPNIIPKKGSKHPKKGKIKLIWHKIHITITQIKCTIYLDEKKRCCKTSTILF